jgi:succinyl-diaminopimelate desuccinylase
MTVSTRRGSETPAPLSDAAIATVRKGAAEDTVGVVDLTQQLVRVPSRSGLDPYEPVIDLIDRWLQDHDLTTRRLHTEAGELVGLACDLVGDQPGRRYVLDACIDTAPFGDEAAWQHPPTAGLIEDGWLHGRGAADSKAAVAIFAHVAARLRKELGSLRGVLTLLYDADEHTGRFGGAKRYFAGPDAPSDVGGVMIGYPGLSKVVVGGRGFLRATLVVYGQASHTGSSDPPDDGNAVDKAALLVRALRRHRTPGSSDSDLGLPPKLTVTAIHGGEGFSVVPDRCEVHVDVRLTPSFDDAAARRLLERVAAMIDRRWPTTQPTEAQYEESWPAYRLGEESPVRVALLEAASHQLGGPPRAKVAGPSNIGCYLASLGIDATAGFGVEYRGLHGTDERIQVATVPVVQAAYHQAVLSLLNVS